MNIKSFAIKAISTVALVPVAIVSTVAVTGLHLLNGSVKVIDAAACGVLDAASKGRACAVNSARVINKQWS